MIQFSVPGKPQAKQRPRVTRRGITYTPKETLLYEEKVLQAAKESKLLPQSPIEGTALKMIIWAYMPIPQSWSKKKQHQAETNEILPISKPDIDNLSKIIMDALNGVAYKDDSQIVELVINKQYSQEPRVEVLICNK